MEDVGAKEQPVRAAHRYLTRWREHLDYAAALEKGLPIGSGEVESGHRHVIQKQLKLAGAWWKETNAEAMLTLRASRATGLWEILPAIAAQLTISSDCTHWVGSCGRYEGARSARATPRSARSSTSRWAKRYP